MPQKSFEEQLRDNTKGFSPEPRQGLWDGIEAQLQPEEKKKRMVLWLPVSIVVLVIGAGALYFLNYKAPGEQVSLEVQSGVPDLKPDPNGDLSGKGSKYQESAGMETKIEDKQVTALKPGSAPVLENTGNLRDLTGNRPDNGGNKTKVAAIETSGIIPREKENINADPVTTEEELTIENALPVNQLQGQEEAKITKSEPQPEDSTNSVATSPEPADTIKSAMRKALSMKEILNMPSSRRRYFELEFLPAYSGSAVTIDENYKDSAPYRSHLEERRANDKMLWNFGIGFRVGIDRKRYQAFAGLYYQALSYQVSVRNINSGTINGTVTGFARFDFNATDSFAMSSKSINATQMVPQKEAPANYVTNSYRFLSLPVGFTYKIKPLGRLRLGLSAHLAPQFLLSYRGLLYQQESGFYVKQKSAAENHIRKTNLWIGTGFEADYHLSSSSAFFIRPQYGISVFPAEKAAIRTGLFSWALAFGYKQYF